MEQARSTESSLSTTDGVTLAVEQSPGQAAVVLLHGLTATRRYVLMGSRRLERSGHRVISYDARGHGHSDRAPNPAAYDYGRLADDLRGVMDTLGLDRAILAGASMGAHTALRFTLEDPDRVAGLVLITPAYDPQSTDWQEGSRAFAGWDALARGLREGGVEGFVAAYGLSAVPERWRATIEKVLYQRLSAHDHPLAVADALETVPRSKPFEDLEQLTTLTVPTIVIASRDDADPGHPLAVGRSYSQSIPGASLIVESSEQSPIAWQGGKLSSLIAELSGRVSW
ncbi:MAG TPA: alpha/beta hydrolase [Solirubrobacteraceae bacterium]|jgi:pimeloyl-ACP methyl ester carboxylesterase